jgi:hypothetical protein
MLWSLVHPFEADMRNPNAAMVAYLAAHGLKVKARHIASGCLRGTWRLSAKGRKWRQHDADLLNSLGFTDHEGRPLTDKSGVGGEFQVFVRGPAEKPTTEEASPPSLEAEPKTHAQAEPVSTVPRPNVGSVEPPMSWWRTALLLVLLLPYLFGKLLRFLGATLVELTRTRVEGTDVVTTSIPRKSGRFSSSLLRGSVRAFLIVLALVVFTGLTLLGWPWLEMLSEHLGRALAYFIMGWVLAFVLAVFLWLACRVGERL